MFTEKNAFNFCKKAYITEFTDELKKLSELMIV